VSGLIGVLRGLHLDDGLAWIGLARRSPLHDLAVFGAGFAAGAGAGLLLAPMSGADTRHAILNQLSGLKREAKDALKKAEHKVESKMAEGAEALKDKAEAAAHALKDRADATGDAMDKGADTNSLN
jgi:gas vesicle protein